MPPQQFLLRSPYFWLGVALKVCGALVGAAFVVDVWYAPFLTHISDQFALDPWSSWLASGGDPAAFPYGPGMLLALSPAAAAGAISPSLAVITYFGVLFVADFALMAVLYVATKSSPRMLIWVYWLSPIVLVATYFFGYNDVIPVLILFMGVLLLQKNQWAWAGALVAAAISIKLSMVLAFPFILIYFARNRSARKGLIRFAWVFMVASAILWVPLFWSPGAMEMILANKEASKVLGLSWTTTTGISLFVVPLAYILVLYSAASARRMNAALMMSTLGLGFLAVVLLAPSPPGWYVWVVPLLVTYGAHGDVKARTLTATFSILFMLYAIFYEGWPEFTVAIASSWQGRIPEAESSLVLSVTKSALVATGLVLGLRIWRDAIQRNDLLRLSRKPFGIAVAGDSGSGKDTVAEGLVGAFGSESVAHVSGDDYHVWDRGQPMWKALTHLNPRANELDRFSRDIADLMNGGRAWVRRYDHETGRRTPPVRVGSREYVVVTGLHALYSEQLRSMYEVSVYLEMDESLRRYLKTRRDISQRGARREDVQAALDRRRRDAENYIHPQREFADLVIAVRPVEPLTEQAVDACLEPRTYLEATSRLGFDERTVARVLVGLCGLRVDFIHDAGTGGSRLVIEGDISEDDVALAARLGCPRMMEFLDSEPRWQGGTRGLTLLLILMTAEQAMTRRLVA